MKKRQALVLVLSILVMNFGGCANSASTEVQKESDMVSEQRVEESSENIEPSEEPDEVMTAAKLLDNLVTAMEGKIMLQTTVAMEMEMSIGIGEYAMNMATVNTSETKMSVEPFLSYNKSSVTMEMDGEQITMDSEVYTVEENDTVVSYMHEPTSGTWLKMDSGVALKDAMQSYTGYEWMKDKAMDELVLEDATQVVEGKDAYVLKCTLTGEEMQKALNGMSNMEDMLEQSGLDFYDYGMLTVPTVFYIDTQTYRPIQIEMEIQGMSELVNNVMTGMAEENGEEDAVSGMNMEISKVYAIYNNISYDAVEVPALPAEAIEAVKQENNSVE